jgi:hypothetical protein
VKIVAGDLVMISALAAFGANVETGIPLYASEDLLNIGRGSVEPIFLRPKDVGLVVCVPSFSGNRVYVVCPEGTGWTAGAYLKVISSARKNTW